MNVSSRDRNPASALEIRPASQTHELQAPVAASEPSAAQRGAALKVQGVEHVREGRERSEEVVEGDNEGHSRVSEERMGGGPSSGVAGPRQVAAPQTARVATAQAQTALTKLARRIAQTAKRLDREIARLKAPAKKPRVTVGAVIKFRRRGSRPALERFEEKFTCEPNSGCWLWLAAAHAHPHNAVVYGSFRLFADENAWRAHRVSWTLYRGPIPEGLCVLHKCDVGLCVNPEHLYLGTVQDNANDMVQRRRYSRKGMKISDADAREAVRAAVAREMTTASLAEKYGVAQPFISQLIQGARRPDLTEDLRDGRDLRHEEWAANDLRRLGNNNAAKRGAA